MRWLVYSIYPESPTTCEKVLRVVLKGFVLGFNEIEGTNIEPKLVDEVRLVEQDFVIDKDEEDSVRMYSVGTCLDYVHSLFMDLPMDKIVQCLDVGLRKVGDELRKLCREDTCIVTFLRVPDSSTSFLGTHMCFVRVLISGKSVLLTRMYVTLPEIVFLLKDIVEKGMGTVKESKLIVLTQKKKCQVRS